MVVGVAVTGWLTSQKIPVAESANQQLKINWNIFTETWNIITSAFNLRLIFGVILAISWFWFIGATMLSLIPLPEFIHQTLHAKEQVITLLLALFSIGIGVGSIIAGRSTTLSNSIKWIVFGAIGISLIALDLYWACEQLLEVNQVGVQKELVSWLNMFQSPLTLHVLIDVLLLGSAGGLYIVPLYVILQEHSPIESRSRTIAANNIVNALFMVCSAIATMLLLQEGVPLHELFVLIGLANIIVFMILFWCFSADVRQII